MKAESNKYETTTQSNLFENTTSSVFNDKDGSAAKGKEDWFSLNNNI